MSGKVKLQAKKLNVDFSFLFIQANGQQLPEMSSLIDAGIKQVSLPRASRIIDVIKDVEIASDSKEFKVELSKGETRLWQIIPLKSN